MMNTEDTTMKPPPIPIKMSSCPYVWARPHHQYEEEKVLSSTKEVTQKKERKRTKKSSILKNLLLVAGALLLLANIMILVVFFNAGAFFYEKATERPIDWSFFRPVERTFFGEPSARPVPKKVLEVVPYYDGIHFVKVKNKLLEEESIQIFQYVRSSSGDGEKHIVSPILKPGDEHVISCSGMAGVHLWYETVDSSGQALESAKRDKKTFLYTNSDEGTKENPFIWEINS